MRLHCKIIAPLGLHMAQHVFLDAALVSRDCARATPVAFGREHFEGNMLTRLANVNKVPEWASRDIVEEGEWLQCPERKKQDGKGMSDE